MVFKNPGMKGQGLFLFRRSLNRCVSYRNMAWVTPSKKMDCPLRTCTAASADSRSSKEDRLPLPITGPS
eukprot:5377703-Pyramimonas_sp.AAC.2